MNTHINIEQLANNYNFAKKENKSLLKLISLSEIYTYDTDNNRAGNDDKELNELINTELIKTALNGGKTPIKPQCFHDYVTTNELIKESSFFISNFKAKKTDIFDFCSNDELRPNFTGVSYKNGYEYATNTHILIKEKSEYNPEFEGKIIKKSGLKIDEKIINFDAVIPDNKIEKSYNLEQLNNILNSILFFAKQVDGYFWKNIIPVNINGYYYNAVHLQKVINYLLYCNQTCIIFRFNDSKSKPLIIENENTLILIMPIVVSGDECDNVLNIDTIIDGLNGQSSHKEQASKAKVSKPRKAAKLLAETEPTEQTTEPEQPTEPEQQTHDFSDCINFENPTLITQKEDISVKYIDENQDTPPSPKNSIKEAIIVNFEAPKMLDNSDITISENTNFEKLEEEIKKPIQKATVRQTTNLLKKYLKAKFGIKAKVKTEIYSGGSSINIYYENGISEKELKKHIDCLQYGHFNGMEDIYEYNNTIPIIIDGYELQQFKHMFINRDCDKFKIEALKAYIAQTNNPQCFCSTPLTDDNINDYNSDLFNNTGSQTYNNLAYKMFNDLNLINDIDFDKLEFIDFTRKDCFSYDVQYKYNGVLYTTAQKKDGVLN